MPSWEQYWLIGYSTGPNYHPGGRQNGMHLLSYTLAESSEHCHFLDKVTQGQSSVFRDILLNKTCREKEAPVINGVPHLVPNSKKPPTPGALLP